MKEYELLFIAKGDLTEAEAAKVSDAVGAKLLGLGGKAKTQNALGRKRLAYPIDDQDHGWYTLLHLELASEKVNDFARQLDVTNEVIRTVLLGAEAVPKPGEVVQTPTAVEESKDTTKVSVPEELRKAPTKSAAPEAVPAAKDAEPEPKKSAKPPTEKELEAALEEQLKD